MKTTECSIGLEVVRSIGDYVVGRIGKVIEIDSEKGRARVQWDAGVKTWVKFAVIEPTSIPYEIRNTPSRNGVRINKTYHRK
ncbi:hypothetical protein [Bacteroides sp.]|uniref:hypothetical protein n=1 Tax=Bacteroides sp. TaxID=29523 RepID=UPI0025BDF302|nr:hypothetical protein [Bacteroides sp.]